MQVNELGKRPYSYEDLSKDVHELASKYPSMVKAYVIGTSHDHREIYMFQVGNGPIPVIFTAGVHARETINPQVLMAMIQNYVDLAIHHEAAVIDFGIRDRTDIVNYHPRVERPFYELSPDVYRNELNQISARQEIPIKLEDDCMRCTAQERREQRKMYGFPDEFTNEIMYAGPRDGFNPENFTYLRDFVIRDRIPYLANANPKGKFTPHEYNIDYYLKHFTFFIIPLLNPDGYEIALNGFDAIREPILRENAKNMEIDAKDWKYNARGVDINRNFPSKTWRASGTNQIPGSENETKALIDVFAMIPAIGYLDFHSRGEGIYYYRNFMDKAYNRRQKYIADRLAEVSGYELMPPEDEIEMNDTGGNTVHYFSENYGKPALTIETVPENATFPLILEYAPQVFSEIYPIPLEFTSAIVEYEDGRIQK